MGEQRLGIDKINRYNYYDRFIKFILFIKVDESCNLSCKFCYQGEKQSRRLDSKEKFDNCFLNLDYVLKRFSELKSGFYDKSRLAICFFGGEPTLNTKAMCTICNYLIENRSIDNIRDSLEVTMTTNGIIFNEDVKNSLRMMKKVNPLNYVNIMISTDNDKEAYDSNRTLIGYNKSAFEIVQSNIEKYNSFLKELNGPGFNSQVSLATVLASSEQIRNTPDLIQKHYKEITRRGKLLYDLESMDSDYISEATNFLSTAYGKMINDLSIDNKTETIDTIMSSLWELKGDYYFKECNFICTIDGDGNINWCNKVRNFEDKILSQDELRKLSVFNRDADNSHFRCSVEKYKNGDLIKNKIRPLLWDETKLRFDPNVPISNLRVDDDLKDIDKVKEFVYYMMCSTNGNKRLYWKNIPEKFKEMIRKYNVVTNEIDDTNDTNVFYLDSLGDLYFDKLLSSDKNLALTNINQKHFMWIYTPRLIDSINIYYRNIISKYLD